MTLEKSTFNIKITLLGKGKEINPEFFVNSRV